MRNLLIKILLIVSAVGIFLLCLKKLIIKLFTKKQKNNKKSPR